MGLEHVEGGVMAEALSAGARSAPAARITVAQAIPEAVETAVARLDGVSLRTGELNGIAMVQNVGNSIVIDADRKPIADRATRLAGDGRRIRTSLAVGRTVGVTHVNGGVMAGAQTGAAVQNPYGPASDFGDVWSADSVISVGRGPVPRSGAMQRPPGGSTGR